jgi:hypothetical protein
MGLVHGAYSVLSDEASLRVDWGGDHVGCKMLGLELNLNFGLGWLN